MKVFAQNRTAAFDKRAVIKCAAAVALLVAASKVSFAIGPVPLTMQTFAVAVVGAWLGTRQGVAAVIAYLALGFAGLPVFATPLCGPAALMGPTAGYLVSFPMAAAISGLLAERGWAGQNPCFCFLHQPVRRQYFYCRFRRTLAFCFHRRRKGCSGRLCAVCHRRLA